MKPESTLSRISNFFSPPKYEDAKEGREAKFAYIVSLSMVIGFSYTVIHMILSPIPNISLHYIYVAFILLSIVLFYLNQKRKLKSPLLSTMLACFAAVSVFMFYAEGTHDEMQNAIPVTLLIVSLAYSREQLFIALVFGIGLIWIIGVAEIGGIIKNRYSFGTTYYQLYIQSFILIVTAFLIDLLVGDLKSFNRELKQKSKELELANEQLHNSNITKDKLFSIIAHDLQSPFQGFIGITEEMATNIDAFSKEDLKNYTSKMNTNAKNLFDMLKNILEWSRLNKGEFKLEKCALNLKKITDNIITVVEASAFNKQITIKNDLQSDTIVIADEKMLSSILLNLITNAIKFTNKNGLITIRSKNADGKAIVSIEDNGIGMPDKLASILFEIDEKISRKGTDGEPSTGLGLILCKEFVEKNDGNIWFDTIENKGTTFYFSIPLTS